MAAPGAGGALFYTPEPHERAYYDGLFQSADTGRSGTIGGSEAVAFFSRSKLPMEQLKNVWTVADNPPSNSLNRPKFAVAVRLIQLLQNGVKGQGSNLAVPPGTPLRPVFLEGISGAVVPVPGPQQQPPPQGIPPGQGPPPQQQQQSPPPAPQQQQPQPIQMNNAGRPPMASQAPGDGNMALTVQDPYTLVPNERARYESLFPQYAVDGYMHGKEAVQLFSKSGMDQAQLRDIWNMVDQPVDNKLDVLEFAICMHLIVCVSKKNLPMPKILPFSLKTLKQQQQQQQAGDSQGQQQSAGIPPGGAAPAYDSQQPSMTIPEPPSTDRMDTPVGGMHHPNLQGPPPLTQPGGMGISDAFEGLSTASSGADGMAGLPPPTSGFGSLGVGSGAEASHGGFGAPSSSMEPSPPQEPTPAPSALSPPRMHQMSQPSPVPQTMSSSVPEPAPKTSEVLASAYNMTDSIGELEKLKTVLQKLQAENVSLKAQLGTMTEEEKDVQRQINATVTEIGDLSNRLTTLRAEVLSSKSRLMEATAELKAAQEKRGVLTDLIAATEATKEAIDTAYQGLEATHNAAQSPSAPPAPAPAFEADLFGFGSAPAVAPPNAEAPAYASAVPPQALGAAPAPFPVPVPYGQDQGGAGGPHQLETVSDSSDDEQKNGGGPGEGVGQQEELFAYNQPPPPNPHGVQGAPNMQAAPYGHEAPNAQQGISFEQNFRPNEAPTHNKQSSISSLSFEVMGGGTIPQDQFAQHHPVDTGFGNDADLAVATSLEEIEHLKKRAGEAEELASDSEETLRQIMSKADRLRKIADAAEVEARQKASEATEKKKGGFMGGGKKKKTMKEATQAKQNAEAKKKQFLEAQAQANDAQAVAMETKREAERLRKQAEQCELDAAAAASMEQKQPDLEPVQPAPVQQQQAANNGFPPQGQAYGHPPLGPQAPYYGQPLAPQNYGQPPAPPNNGQFNPSVMGQQGGGINIPSPAAGDPYANPF